MTFYFYDLETSGINSRAQRIMQFAGQRTDENLNPVGEPQNWLVKISEEVLPDPDAVLITGITPQKTLEEGYSEAEFLKLFMDQVCQPDTVIVGFNTIRFDDEFMRMALYRNFYDPYEWQWQDGRSRWDILDVVRMVRALRPEGIEWPFEPARKNGLSEHGKFVAPKEGYLDPATMVPTNRLELLTKANGLDHENAHDALNDVYATIAVAKLLKEKQSKIFEYLLGMRDKKKVAEIVNLDDPKPFLYTSGRYSNKWQKTTAVISIAEATHGAVLVYDLRQDPLELAQLTDEELKKVAYSRSEDTEIVPVKILKPNTCPAVAPLGVLDKASQERLDLSEKTITENFNKLRSIAGFTERLAQLFTQVDEQRRSQYPAESDPDFQLYDGFVGPGDKTKLRAVRSASENDLADLALDFADERFSALLPRYKARNFPRSLTPDEREAWESYRTIRLTEGVNGQLSIPAFAQRLNELSAVKSDEQSQYLLQELQLYAESIAPVDE